MVESNNRITQQPASKKNWYKRSKITSGLIALILIFLILVIIFLATTDSTQVYIGSFLELYVGLAGIYFIVWVIIKRKMLKIYLSVVWTKLHVWECENSSSQQPKTLKDWVSCHKVTSWSIALLIILLILNYGIRPILHSTGSILIVLLFVTYIILFVIYYIARVFRERQSLVKDFTGLWAIFTKK
jgi:hypothetical protein